MLVSTMYDADGRRCGEGQKYSRGTEYSSQVEEKWTTLYIPNSDVRTLPDTADSIFCEIVTSPMPAVASASSALCVAVAMSWDWALIYLEGVRGVQSRSQGRRRAGMGIV